MTKRQRDADAKALSDKKNREAERWRDRGTERQRNREIERQRDRET